MSYSGCNCSQVGFLPKDSSAVFHMERFKKAISRLDDEQLMGFSDFVQEEMHHTKAFLLKILAPEEISKAEPGTIYWQVLGDCNGLNLIDQLIKEKLAEMGIREW